MKRIILFILISVTFFISNAQNLLQDVTGDYLGQQPPKDSAVIFAPDIVSVTGRYEYGLAISPNHDEIFFTCEAAEDTTKPVGLLHIKRIGNEWLTPQKANLNQQGLWEQEAFFAPDGNTIYYAVSDTSSSTKIWYSNKADNGWSKGKSLNSPINTSAKRLFYTTLSKNKNLYYTNVDEFKIYVSKPEDNSYVSFKETGLPRAGHAFISADESFIIFDSRLEENYGELDIYVAFRTDNENWGEPINLGKTVNSEYSETCPSLSPDGKYIFFGRYNEENEKSNIYWISSEIIMKRKP